MGFLEKML